MNKKKKTKILIFLWLRHCGRSGAKTRNLPMNNRGWRFILQLRSVTKPEMTTYMKLKSI